MIRNFLHSGARGDIIYGLPTILALGGGTLYINQSKWNQSHKSRALTDKDIEWFNELLHDQHYIEGVKKWQEGVKIDIDLDKFRDGYTDFVSLAELHLRAVRVYVDLRNPWIYTSVFKPNHVADIVVNRSGRYHGPFDWGELRRWQDKCIFVGLEQEYSDFVKVTGLESIKYFGECSYRNIVEVILGSKLFIGNQSFPYSLAEAIKHPRVLEVLPLAPNCLLGGACSHTRLTQNVLEHYLLGEPLQQERILPYYQATNPSPVKLHRDVPNISFIIPLVTSKDISDFIDKAKSDGAEVITISQTDKSFEELANLGAKDATGNVLCVVDTRKDISYLAAFKLASQLVDKEGFIGAHLNISRGRPYMTGEYVAVSRKAYEECGLFNINMLPGELNYLEMNLRYTKRRYACRSGGLIQQSITLDDNQDRNAAYISKVYGVKV